MVRLGRGPHDASEENRLRSRFSEPEGGWLTRGGGAAEATVTRCLCGGALPYCEQQRSSSLRPSVVVSMLAVPHTASSSNDEWVRKALSIPAEIRVATFGAACSGQCAAAPNGHLCAARATGCSDAELNCTLSAMSLHSKAHENWARHSLNGNGPARHAIRWTMLRAPAGLLASHFRERAVWDKAIWPVHYPDVDRKALDVVGWASRAWWRDNIFTKILAVRDARSIWAGVAPGIWTPGEAAAAAAKAAREAARRDPAQEEGERENALGVRSAWLATATARLESLPFFGIFENTSATSELLAFHLCACRPRPRLFAPI